MDVVETVSGLVSRVAESRGLELVDVEIFKAGRRRILRIFIGKAEGVSIEDCATVSRDLGALMEAENVLEDESYTLEVSSPGLDRPFKRLGDYRRNIGRFVRISLHEPMDGKFQMVGRLDVVAEDVITLDQEGAKRQIPLESIAMAKVEIRF